MDRDDARAVIAEVLGAIAPEVDLGDIDPGGPLQEEVDLDSMDFLELVGAVHDRTGVDVPERDYDQVATLEGFVDYLCTRSAT